LFDFLPLVRMVVVVPFPFLHARSA